MPITGSCHCRNICFALLWEPEPERIVARACGCSFCTRHGGVWTANPGGPLKIRIEDPLRVCKYSFGTHTAEFHVCSTCGVVPIVTSTIDSGLYAVVNVNTFDGVEKSLLQVVPASFDEESEATRLARRKRNWIARVEYVTSGI